MSAFIVCSNLSFSWPDGTPVLENVSFVAGVGRTGLVAPNGAGKTTLLKLLAGQLVPSGGSVSTPGVLGYLPQNLPLATDVTVAEVLGVAEVLAALDALHAGDAREEIFTIIGEDWDIAERIDALLDRLDLGHLGLDRSLGSVSGGEIMSLGLAAQLLKRPDVLLLDEPTNNLDLGARRRLYTALDNYSGCLVVASHDRTLLEHMDSICELTIDEIRCYGGNYSYYEQAVAAETQLAEQNLRNAELDLKRQKLDRQKARERAARRTSTAERGRQDAGVPKILLNKRKGQAQESAGRGDQTHAARIEAAHTRVTEASRALRDQPTINVDLPDTQVPAGRTIFSGEHIQLQRGGQPVFAGDGITLTIRGPERIALTGPNGAGKSTLLHAISGQQPTSGRITRVDGGIAYLTQRLDILDSDRTVADNLAAFAPHLPHAERMTRLARFLFPGPRAHLLVSALSGGERLRATLACVLNAEPAPQLLLLDEPTNNLDLHSVAQLQSALRSYQGALIVVSHDQRFLIDLKPDRWLHLCAGRLDQITPPERA
ncbi:MAG: ATP-binding cassette domain-containing protein [Mycobacteriaceae bacterium]|nr:ATP-binding cassette domain-containing protein [Mycobacteriaceae bacterium]